MHGAFDLAAGAAMALAGAGGARLGEQGTDLAVGFAARMVGG